MNINDAANLLNVTGDITPLIAKKAFKSMSLKYHPDKGGSVHMMQAINEAYAVLKDFTGNINSDDLGYSDLLNEAILKVIDLEGIIIEVCGNWLWLTGSTKQHSKALGKDGAGFFYASKKKAWYFRPAKWKSSNRGTYSMEKIREEHGSVNVTKRPQNRTEAMKIAC